MVTAGIDMRNISVYIGSNDTSVFANTRVHVRAPTACLPAVAATPGLPAGCWAGCRRRRRRHCSLLRPSRLPAGFSCLPTESRGRPTSADCRPSRCLQEGLGLGAGQQRAVAANATRGRYVIIYGGTTAQATLGLDDVQVYTYGEPQPRRVATSGPAAAAGPLPGMPLLRTRAAAGPSSGQRLRVVPLLPLLWSPPAPSPASRPPNRPQRPTPRPTRALRCRACTPRRRSSWRP